MRMRQEQIVFLAAIAILGLMVWSLFSEGATRGSSRRGGGEAELTHFKAPDVGVALPDDSKSPPLARELFTPPRDTRPLPPLELIEPPRANLPGLLPPTEPGPAPRYYGRWLRVNVAAMDAPELFVEADGGLDVQEDLDFLGLADGEDEEDRPRQLIGALRDLEEQEPEETPAERQARYAGYRQRYDWIQQNQIEYIFGRIENQDRYGLKTNEARGDEPVLFTRVRPETGREYFENIGAPPIPYERGAMTDFGFAETVANEIELERRLIGDALTRGSYDRALRLADYCVRQRLEAPRALEVAEELYKLCAAFDKEDPAPRLGLGNCYEAGFDFEAAFQEYNALLETFAHRPEVHVRLASLEARFLLFEQAEKRLRQALTIDRGSWHALWGLGSYLADRGEYDEAVEHLQAANRAAPQDPELKHVRVSIRTDLADALFAKGAVREAHGFYRQALSADSGHQRARAGLVATRVLSPDDLNGAPAGQSDQDEGAGFEEQLALGIAAVVDGNPTEARDLLLSAVEADPLRANRALAALSFLAERTGNLEEALRFADEALVCDPSDAFALYQQGRLRGSRDDYEGARQSLLGALEVELDFEDALVSLGEMAFRLGRFDDAERYLERGVGIEGKRPEVHALRGINFLRLGAVLDARESFEEALKLQADHATALCGVAWCTYLGGDRTEAKILLGNIDEGRRDFPDEDPFRVWARQQIERITDHEQKFEWGDTFNRKRLANSWSTNESRGVTVSMVDGAVQVQGSFGETRSVNVTREYPASLFVSMEADVWVDAKSNVRAGIFIARERRRRNASEIISEASVSRHKEGGLQIRFVNQGRAPELTDMQQPFPTGEWVRLRIERSGEASGAAVTVSMDGVPLVENVSMASLGTSASPLIVGFFVEGEAGRQVLAKMDNVSIVYRQ